MSFTEQYQEYVAYHIIGAMRDWRRWLRLAITLDKAEKHQWFFDILNSLGGEDMTRAKATAKTAKTVAESNWTTFVDIPISEAAWPDIEATYGTSDQITEAFEEMLTDGYRLSFSYNPQSDAVICAMTCRDETSPNNKKTVTSFAGNWVEALQVSLYKHNVISERVWGDGVSKVSRPRIG